MLMFSVSLCLSSYSSLPLTPTICSSATFENGKKYQLVETTTRVKIMTEEEECQVMLNVLLVGGEGDVDTFDGYGGGSGFVAFKQVRC